MTKVFTYIKAAQFLPKYAPSVANWKHKLRKIDGNKKPIDFSDADKAAIKKGLRQLFKDLG